jgi:hypothetical protein
MLQIKIIFINKLIIEMFMKKALFNLLILSLILSSATLLSQSSSKDTVIKNNLITKNLIILPTGGNLIYMLPPEKSFSRDTNEVFLGFSSEKYQGVTLKIILSESGYDDDENIIRIKYNILQQGVMRINNSFDLWYYKLSPKENPEIIIWNILFRNEFFYGNAKCSYNVKDDKILGKGMEKSINSFVIIQRPDIYPTSNVIGVGNFDKIPLKFVKKASFCVTYYTEDGFPIDKTKGKKIFAFVTAPMANFDPREESETATTETNKIFKINNINDSIIVEKIEPTTIMEFEGLKLSGSLASDNRLSFFSYYAKILGKTMFFMIYGVCESEDKEEFDKILDDFRKSVERRFN